MLSFLEFAWKMQCISSNFCLAVGSWVEMKGTDSICLFVCLIKTVLVPSSFYPSHRFFSVYFILFIYFFFWGGAVIVCQLVIGFERLVN